MDQEHRSKLLKEFDDEAKKIRTPEESIKNLISIGVLAANGDLSSIYYPYPEGCLQVWKLEEIKV